MTDTPSQQKVTPCPFGCESKPYAAIFNDGTHIAIFCPVCGTEGPIHDTEPKALAAWNERPTSPAAERVGDVKRFEATHTGMIPDSGGQYVLHADYAKLEAELEQAKQLGHDAYLQGMKDAAAKYDHALAALEPRQGTDARVREALADLLAVVYEVRGGHTFGPISETHKGGWANGDGIEIWEAMDNNVKAAEEALALLADGHGGGR